MKHNFYYRFLSYFLEVKVANEEVKMISNSSAKTSKTHNFHVIDGDRVKSTFQLIYLINLFPPSILANSRFSSSKTSPRDQSRV